MFVILMCVTIIAPLSFFCSSSCSANGWNTWWHTAQTFGNTDVLLLIGVILKNVCAKISFFSQICNINASVLRMSCNSFQFYVSMKAQKIYIYRRSWASSKTLGVWVWCELWLKGEPSQPEGEFEQVISVVQLAGDTGTKKGCVSSRDNYWVYGIW